MALSLPNAGGMLVALRLALVIGDPSTTYSVGNAVVDPRAVEIGVGRPSVPLVNERTVLALSENGDTGVEIPSVPVVNAPGVFEPEVVMTTGVGSPFGPIVDEGDWLADSVVDWTIGVIEPSVPVVIPIWLEIVTGVGSPSTPVIV